MNNSACSPFFFFLYKLVNISSNLISYSMAKTIYLPETWLGLIFFFFALHPKKLFDWH